jgi:hypothetical protein
MSIFTPQREATNPECLTVEERRRVVETLQDLRQLQHKLDMTKGTIAEFLSPPTSPERCIFARTTRTLSADLTTRVEPCQFGGDPDCSRCGCIASMGMAAIGHHKLVGSITAGDVFWASTAIGDYLRRGEDALRRLVNRNDHHWDHRTAHVAPARNPLRVLNLERATSPGCDPGPSGTRR